MDLVCIGTLIVDPVGCDDAFVAAFLTHLIADSILQQIAFEDLQDALRYGNTVAELTSLKAGVIPALPRHAEVEAYISRSRNV